MVDGLLAFWDSHRRRRVRVLHSECDRNSGRCHPDLNAAIIVQTQYMYVSYKKRLVPIRYEGQSSDGWELLSSQKRPRDLLRPAPGKQVRTVFRRRERPVGTLSRRVELAPSLVQDKAALREV